MFSTYENGDIGLNEVLVVLDTEQTFWVGSGRVIHRHL